MGCCESAGASAPDGGRAGREEAYKVDEKSRPESASAAEDVADDGDAVVGAGGGGLPADLEPEEPEEPDSDAIIDAPLCKFGCGKPVAPGTTRKGNPFDTCCRACALNKGIGVHDATCGGRGSKATTTRLACKKGSRCRDRSEAHLFVEAHPLDSDYAIACAATKGVEAEQLTLRVLFDWTDADGSGKLSRDELESTLAQIKGLVGDLLPKITEDAWHHLDEDGNGVVNFYEFASWAGPRLGLPLGMKKMLGKSGSVAAMSCPCSVMGCPCENFVPPDGCKKIRGNIQCKGCRHKHSVHHQRTHTSEVPPPDYWQNQSSDDFNCTIPLLAKSEIDQFQLLLNRTFFKRFTRDRQKHNPVCPRVPDGYTVINVSRNENFRSWTEYACRRAELLTRIDEDKEGSTERVQLYSEVKSTVAWKAIAGSRVDQLIRECNEWYLFHGTNPDAARSICENDFKVSRSGTNTGTLYGKGLYFAESITKADEYSKPNSSGLYAVLLCRVVGGNVLYNDEVTPDPEMLVHNCIEGKYDSVCGDREKCRGTFREFILYDSQDVYPEYIIEYTRNF